MFPLVFYMVLFFYRNLERDKKMALQCSKGDCMASISLSQESLAELQWWYDNIYSVHYPICTPNSKVDVAFYSDVSKLGWGAVMNQEIACFRRSDSGGRAKNKASERALFFARPPLSERLEQANQERAGGRCIVWTPSSL